MADGFYYGGGVFGNFLDQLAQAGFFSYIVPFLLIFALVYGILIRTKVFSEKMINGIIALAVALLALQFDYVPLFFSQVFPRAGVALGVLLIVIILLGLFLPSQTWVTPTLFGIAAISLIVVLVSSSNVLGSPIGSWFLNNWPWMVGLLALVLIIAIIVNAGKEPKPTFKGSASPFLRDLFGLGNQTE